MKAHICCKEPNDDKILHRLAAVLARETGWSLGATPRGDVFLNYFFPYLFHEPVATKTAAWFTHRDDAHQEKVRRWQDTANTVNLRLTSARLYLGDLAGYGTSALVPPPIDRDVFAPARHLPDVFTVGVSGFSYHDGRKGEDLIRRLMSDFTDLNWQTIGRGWTAKTRQIQTSDLAAFYQSISLFVCASRIEGIPMTVLEALACGVPVVIPRNVGLLDELPELEGIYRFTAGSYDDLRRAFSKAVDALRHSAPDRDALRASTEPYTPLAWARAHERAFEDLLQPPVEDQLSDWRGNAGAYYVAFGAPARECASNAVRHWHHHMRDVPAALISEQPIGIEDVFVQQPDTDIGGRIAKMNAYVNAPAEWQYVLYMDADTEVIADVSFLFQVLADGWHFVICKNPERFHIIREMKRPDNHDECEFTFNALGSDELLQLNGGVFGFRRCEPVRRFFERWRAEWERYGKRDQAALLRALYAEPLKVYVLGNQWNTITRYDPPESTAGILHYPMSARRYTGHFNARLDSPEAWAQVEKWERANSKK